MPTLVVRRPDLHVVRAGLEITHHGLHGAGPRMVGVQTKAVVKHAPDADPCRSIAHRHLVRALLGDLETEYVTVVQRLDAEDRHTFVARYGPVPRVQSWVVRGDVAVYRGGDRVAGTDRTTPGFSAIVVRVVVDTYRKRVETGAACGHSSPAPTAM